MQVRRKLARFWDVKIIKKLAICGFVSKRRILNAHCSKLQTASIKDSEVNRTLAAPLQKKFSHSDPDQIVTNIRSLMIAH